jgi:hypothetical protein
MRIEEQTIERTDALIEKGQNLFQYLPNDQYRQHALPISAGVYTMWRSQCLSFLLDLLGPSHVYTQEFQSRAQPSSPVGAVLPIWVSTGLGVIRGLREDLANGYFGDFRTLISAEVFSDLLGQADYLAQRGYKNPAASLCGAVLEDGLRRIALAKGVIVKSSDDLNALSQRCAQAGVYSSLTFKKIKVWIEIRNKADHGQFDQFADVDVTNMLAGVQSFLSDWLR